MVGKMGCVREMGGEERSSRKMGAAGGAKMTESASWVIFELWESRRFCLIPEKASILIHFLVCESELLNNLLFGY